jgi:hypothetical protein
VAIRTSTPSRLGTREELGRRHSLIKVGEWTSLTSSPTN